MEQVVATSILSAPELWSVTRSCSTAATLCIWKSSVFCSVAPFKYKLLQVQLYLYWKVRTSVKIIQGKLVPHTSLFHSFFCLKKSFSLTSPLAHTKPLSKSFAQVKPILVSMARDPAESLSFLKTCSSWSDVLITKLFVVRYSWCWQWFLI